MEPWVKVERITPGKARVRRIAKLLGIPRAHAFGCCMILWIYADAETADGFLPLLDADEIDEIVGLKGFADAMVKVEWLRLTDEGAYIEKYDDHMSQSAKARAQNNRDVAKSRSRKKKERVDDECKDEPLQGCKEKTLPENKREEENTSSPTPSSESGSEPIAESPPVEEEGGEEVISEDWRPVYDALVDANVLFVEPCIAQARKQQHTPESALAVVNVYVAHQWEIGGAGFLYQRLANVPARAAPHANWQKKLTLPRKPDRPELASRREAFFAQGRDAKVPEAEIERLWSQRLEREQGGQAA